MFPQRLAVAVLASIALARAAVLPRNEVGVGRHGAVVTEVAQCSDIGLEMLLVGGSAADAVSFHVSPLLFIAIKSTNYFKLRLSFPFCAHLHSSTLVFYRCH